MNVTIFRSAFATDPSKSCPIGEVLESIKNPTPTVAKLIADIRTEPDKGARNNLKKELPAVCFGAELRTRAQGKTEAEKVVAESGFICLDFDNLSDVDATKESLKGAPYIHAMFVSPSGNGLKVLVPILGGFQTHWRALADYMKVTHCLVADEARKDLVGLCYVSHDPEIWIAEGDVAPFAATTEPRKNQTNITATGGDVLPDYLDARKVEEVLNVLNADMDYDQWLDVGMGVHCQLGGVGLAVFDSWSSRGSKYQGFEEVAKKWQSFGGSGITFKSVLKMAFDAGYQMPRSVVERSKSASVDGERVEAPEKVVLRSHADRLRDRLTPGPMIIADLCPEGGIAAIIAMPGVGKTLMAAALAESIATGHPFAGHAVSSGSVIYVCSDSPASTESRFLALSDEAAAKVFTIIEIPSLPSGLDALRQTAVKGKDKSGEAVKLIVYDTWDSSREHSSGGYADQDGGAEAIMRGLRTIAAELKCAVLILHHATRADTGRARGTVVFDARCDWIAVVEKGASGLVLKSTKCRDGECGIVGTWSIVPVQVGERLVPVLRHEAASTSKLATIDAADSMLAAAREMISNGTVPTARNLGAVIGRAPSAVARLAGALRARGLMSAKGFLPVPSRDALEQTLEYSVPLEHGGWNGAEQTVKMQCSTGTTKRADPKVFQCSTTIGSGTWEQRAEQDVGFDVDETTEALI